MASDTKENITHGCAQIRLFGYIQDVLNYFVIRIRYVCSVKHRTFLTIFVV